MSGGCYAVAEFENRVISVIPVSWIFKEGSKLFCHWTSSRQRVICQERPNPNWPLWPIVRIVARRDTYDKAEELSDSYSSDARLSDIPDKENLFTTNPSRIRRKNRKFVDENGINDNDVENDVSCHKQRKTSTPKKTINSSSVQKYVLPVPPNFKAGMSRPAKDKANSHECGVLSADHSFGSLVDNSNINNEVMDALDDLQEYEPFRKQQTSRPCHTNVSTDNENSATKTVGNDNASPTDSGTPPGLSGGADRRNSMLSDVISQSGRDDSATMESFDTSVRSAGQNEVSGQPVDVMSMPASGEQDGSDYVTRLPVDENPRRSDGLHSDCAHQNESLNSGRTSAQTNRQLSSTLTRQIQSSSLNDVVLRVLQVAEETRMMVMECQRNLEVLRTCMGSSSNHDLRVDDTVRQLMQKPLESMDEMESLNDLLNSDRQKCRNVVAFLCIAPGKDLAEKTRNVLKKVMADKLQMMFNYEGRGTKSKKSLKEFPALLSVVFQAVRRNWSGVEQYNVKAVRHAVCECLKHATQREARRQARVNNEQQNRIVDTEDDLGQDEPQLDEFEAQ